MTEPFQWFSFRTKHIQAIMSDHTHVDRTNLCIWVSLGAEAAKVAGANLDSALAIDNADLIQDFGAVLGCCFGIYSRKTNRYRMACLCKGRALWYLFGVNFQEERLFIDDFTRRWRFGFN